MTRAYEQRIAAALDNARTAGTETLDQIASAATAMARVWEEMTREAESLEGREVAVRSVAEAYARELSQFCEKYPSCQPERGQPAASLPGGGVRRGATGWVVSDEIVERLRRHMHEARAEARDAATRMFGAGRARENARAKAEVVQRTIASLQAEAATLRRQLSTHGIAARNADVARRRIEADRDLADASQRLSEAVEQLPPAFKPWDAPAWRAWAPALDHAEVLYGFLRLQREQVPPPIHDFGWNVRVPVFVPTRGALHLAHARSSRQAAHGAARSLLLRAIAATPPGKLRLTIFDPLGLGESVAPLLELGEYDRELIGGKVWSSSEDLRRILGEHTAHIELVIQKYLRAEFAKLEDFNAAAGEIAEAYRLLVIFDAPSGFDEATARELTRILENGQRCGVATLLVTDRELPAPYGVDFGRLPANVRTFQLPGTSAFPAGSSVQFELTPSTDDEARAEIARSIVAQVGSEATKLTSSAVTFQRAFALFSSAAMEGRKRGLPRLTAPVDVNNPATWWTQTTLESVAAPIGLRGARDVATLVFDSSDHAGALLVGRPGSGKSTLLHAFIAGITTMYGPEELELHLIDFKEGVEFKVYGAQSLPHARTVAIESDREFGVSVLQTLHSELTWRGSLLRGSAETHSSLQMLRTRTGERLPRIVLIFDEFQVLFARNDRLGGVAAEVLELLIRQGRGFGIHVLLGSQSLAGLDALGSHVPQLLPVRVLLPAAATDVYKVMGEGNTEGSALTTAGDGLLNLSGGAVEANERFRGAMIDEERRRARVAAMRAKADESGFTRRPVVFEGNTPIPAADVPPSRFVGELRGADRRTLRLRFGMPMAITGSADINLRREAGANVLLVARDGGMDTAGFDAFSLPRSVVANMMLSAVAQQTTIELVDFLPGDEGMERVAGPLLTVSAVSLTRRRQVPTLLGRLSAEVQRRLDEDDVTGPTTLLVLYGMHRARDFDQDSLDFEVDLSDQLRRILRDGPEVGVHTLMWFETTAAIGRRLPSTAVREVAWRLAGRMSADDSTSLVGVDGAASLREQQVLVTNEDRGVIQRCTSISEPPLDWISDLIACVPRAPKERFE